jgi:mRNA (2'-O-methyladenosine-N6-)-methyltransferase
VSVCSSSSDGSHAEIFGRQNNLQPGWITLGNQLEGVYLADRELQKKVEDFLEEQKKQLLAQMEQRQ